ncbi:MAG: hypothetical protein OEV39_07955 [Gammaproteobacteria bacterium]|nr:hypothetical protein [Gammaproteobacteria bacterium]
MILRRLIRHLKDQQWSAIALDLLIVVLGVFIGIQVSNWNEGRRDRQSEREYLDRLRQEIAVILPQAQSTKAALADHFGRIEELRAFLASGLGRDALDDRHCVAAGRSHIYAATIFYPPTIKELISTGRILQIRDPAIRTAIMSFDQAYTDMSQLRTDIQIDRMVLARHYPQLIDSGLSVDWSGPNCDFEAMRHDPAFLNDFTDNMRRYSAYAADVGERQVDALALLERALADGLPPPAVQAPGPSAQANPAETSGGD